MSEPEPTDAEGAAATAAAAAAAAGAGGQQRQQRFRVKKWNAVAVWSWNVLTDTCAICRNNLHEPSIEYQAQGFVEEQDHPGLSIAWGTCGHVFHLDCIQRWLSSRSVCPLCNREWEFAKIERIGTGYGID